MLTQQHLKSLVPHLCQMKPGKAIIILHLAVSLSAKHQKPTTVDLVGMRITEASFICTSTKSLIGSDVIKLSF